MVERYSSNVSVSRPSGRVTHARISTPNVGTRELEDVWTSVACRVKHCRPRPPGPVQSSPSPLCPVLCLYLPCSSFCSCSCAFPVFCYCLPSSVSPGFQSNLSAGPRWDLFLSVLSDSYSSLSCVCLPLSGVGLSCCWSCVCLLSCCCVAASKSCSLCSSCVWCSCPCVVVLRSCFPKSPNAFNLPQLKVSAVRYLNGAPKVTKVLYLPNVICWCSCDFFGVQTTYPCGHFRFVGVDYVCFCQIQLWARRGLLGQHMLPVTFEQVGLHGRLSPCKQFALRWRGAR